MSLSESHLAWKCDQRFCVLEIGVTPRQVRSQVKSIVRCCYNI